MGLGARGGWAVVMLGALLLLALLKVAVDSSDQERFPSSTVRSMVPQNTSTTSPGTTTHVSSSHINASSSSTVKPSTTPFSSKNMTTTTLKPVATSKMTTPGVSTKMTSTTLKSTPKITSVSQNTSQMSTSTMTTTHNSSMMTTTHNGSVTSVSSSVTITATINSKENKGSKFDTGSFVGGIVLTLGILSILYMGCKIYYSRRGIRYTTMRPSVSLVRILGADMTLLIKPR
uniref:Transmembrane protein 123 n=1 Tax=Equus caballus TaxID=9796 RepID=A0A5F5PRC4_HORSE